MQEPDLERLIATIDMLRGDIAAHKADLAITERRSRWARTAAVVGILVGVIGIAIGTGGVVFGAHAQGTADDIARERTDSRLGACIQANVATRDTREALVDGVSVLAAPGAQRTPDQQAAVDRFVAAYTTHVQAALPYRSCSPEGIAAYLARPPADPAAAPTTTTTTRTG